MRVDLCFPIRHSFFHSLWPLLRARTVAGESPEAAEWDMYWRITGRAAAYVRSPFHFCERLVDKSEWDESPTLWMAAERGLVCARPRRAWLRLDLAYEFRKTA